MGKPTIGEVMRMSLIPSSAKASASWRVAVENADASRSDLTVCDLSTLVTLGVRAGFEPMSVDQLLVGADVALKSVQIKNESRRHQLAKTSPFSY